MHVVLQVTSENHADRKIVLRHGQAVNIGRGGSNDFAFPDDAKMSREHCTINFSDGVCRLKLLKGSKATTRNGEPVTRQTDLQDGDEIVVGQTRFNVSVEGVVKASPPAASTPDPVDSHPTSVKPVLDELDDLTAKNSSEAEAAQTDPVMPATVGSDTSVPTDSVPVDSAPVEPEPIETELPELGKDIPLEGVKTPVFEYFQQLSEPLYAILDAARDPLVHALLIQSDDEYQSLYEGTKGGTLAAVAPYLVKLPSDSRLLRKLVGLGWGGSWGVYLTSDQPFKDVRKHFRKFLMVKTDQGKEVYFRFYDPRVLRVFLPTCLPAETKQFFGPITSYYLEGDTPENLLRFPPDLKGASEMMKLSAEIPLQA